MNPVLFTSLVGVGLLVGIIGSIAVIHAFAADHEWPTPIGWTIIVGGLFMWWWLPWLIYGLISLPMPPREQTETQYNLNGGPAVEKL